MKELEEGKIYTSKELAEWFCISYGTFRNQRKQRVSDLSAFADWEQTKRNQYLIKKVYQPVYDLRIKKTKDIVAENLPTYLQEIDTCINVGTKINREVFNSEYTDKYIAALVGQVIKENPQQYHYTKCVGIKKGCNGAATFRLFTPSEEKKYFQVIKDYCHELAVDKEQEMREDLKKRERGEISDREFRNKIYLSGNDFDIMEFHHRVALALGLTDEEYANRLRKFEQEQEYQVFIF